jgi:NAD(P)-dependent dehydrogenase (short-subunit alcohol dehydrogenase family)
MESFHNQVAVVTGTSSGNGRAIALALAQGGAKVVCSDIRKTAREGGYEDNLTVDTDDVIRDGGGQAIFVKADASKAADMRTLFDEAVTTFGRVDILVNNAGVFTGLKTIVDQTEEEYDFTMAVNAKGVWLGCKYAITQMLRQNPRPDGTRGRIINIASIGGLIGLAEEAAYCASKGAVVNLTRQLAVDFARHRINVNAVCPGFLATAMVRPFLDDPDLRTGVENLTPWPRVGTADDVAKAVCYLASDGAEWVSGSMLTVDGAFTAR